MKTLLALIVLLVPSAALAEDPPHEARVGGLVAISGALDRGGVAYRVGARWDATPRFMFGIDLEHNPWFSLETLTGVPGVLNFYLTASYRWTRVDDVELQTTAHLGVSALLFDLYSADSFSVGPYLGLSLLGVAIDLEPGLALIIEPADVSIPVPQLRGVPFAYKQYRLTVGLRWFP